MAHDIINNSTTRFIVFPDLFTCGNPGRGDENSDVAIDF